jgi:hypothetical protein
MKELILVIAKALVDHPDQVQVLVKEDDDIRAFGSPRGYRKNHRQARTHSEGDEDGCDIRIRQVA